MTKKILIAAFLLLGIFLIADIFKKNLLLQVKKGFNVIIAPLNVEHYLSCEQLPTTNQVKDVMRSHNDTILNLISLGSDSVIINGKKEKVKEYYGKKDQVYFFDGAYVSVLLNQYTNENNKNTGNDQICPKKADILIYFVRPEDKKQIQSVIGKDFFGIPYRMIKK